MCILFIMCIVLALGVIVVIIGICVMGFGMCLFLSSINCGDVSFCYEEKMGVILMTIGALVAGVTANNLPYLSQIKSKTR